ncbi:PKD domain-containing protein [Belliella kenyensis]|uniref:PKD domain-containing protein n=1 Tax=Belliella kenyensis TaxID=1472724 RepID=A0ABV8EPR0_9BACT|nr:PKD domain-containing protein [Belliella kenyensis]MCH7403365.1 PKD domain-containing protein [Belliella kenyensis]MDN3601577.1 PKD domain-containing protein [Belliella kenyensis]
MSTITKHARLLAMALITTLVYGACVEEGGDLQLPEPGELIATSSTSSVMAGEIVTFRDQSTKVHTRRWSFQGGTPAVSEDEEVDVIFERGGTFIATLEVTYIDNLTDSKTFTIEVEGLPEPEVQRIGFYTENPAITEMVSVNIQRNNQFTITEVETNAFEGTKALALTIDGSSDWAMASITPQSGPVDLSDYEDGFYNVAMKSTSNGEFLIRFQSAGQNAILKFTASGEEYGFKRDGNWHKLSIPIADFKAANNSLNLSAINNLLVFRSEGDVRNANNYDFYIDDFYISK